MRSTLVGVDNFKRAETDRYFASTIKQAGGPGRFHHYRELMPIAAQTVVRSNRDTLYSAAVFDLDAGPVTITMPDPGKRFMSLMLIDEDQYVPKVIYEAGPHTFERDTIGTRYVMAGVRTLVDPTKPGDLAQVHALQNAIHVDQKSSGRFEVPAWDPATLNRVREALMILGSSVPDSKRMFGPRGEVDPVRHLIGTAIGWGGNPEKDATYLIVTPRENDGKTVHELVVGDVPVDAFWSISVYDAKGYFRQNPQDAYTVNAYTAVRGVDGAITVRFGGYDGKTPNCLPITAGWNYLVRLYRPRAEILSGAWTFPEARPVARGRAVSLFTARH